MDVSGDHASSSTLDAAHKAHRAGNLNEAELLYRQVLQQDRSCAEAFHSLGLVALKTKRLEEAARLMREAIELNASNPDYRANLGTILQAQGRQDEAIEQFEQALRRQPDSWQLRYNLGNALKDRGSLDAAAEHYRLVLQARPDCVEAHANLGVVLLQQRELESAIQCFQNVLRLNPDLVLVHYKLGKAYHLQEQPELAVHHYREVIRQQPTHVKAYVELSRVFTDSGQLPAAVDCLRQALRKNPNDSIVLQLLSQALRDTGNLAAAADYLRRIVQLSPRSADTHFNLGLTLEDQGKLDEANECYRQTLRLNPTFTTAVVSQAGILEKKGDLERAIELVKPHAQAKYAEIDAVVLYASLRRQLGHPTEAVDQLNDALRRNDLTNKWKMVTHTHLGQLYDRLGEYDQAFESFQRANRLKPGRFDLQQHTRMVDQIVTAFSREQLARLPRATGHSTVPTFVVGMPRSGTSLVEQILASHPQVVGAGELMDIEWMTESLPSKLGSRDPFPECINQLTQRAADDLAGQYLSRLREISSTARHVTDKLPHNYFNVGFIRLLFPTAIIVHCRRDPRDTCLSCYCANFLASQTFANDLGILGGYYNQYSRLMRHWNATLDAPMLDITYEDLVRDPEPVCRQLFAHLDLPWDPQCLRFHQSDRFVNTASYQQVRQPIYTNSVGRWKNYETFLGPLIEALQ